MTKKRILPPDRLAECKAAHDLFLAKKNELKLSQKKIADAAGMTPAAVNLYFKGINPLNTQFAAVLSRMLQEPVERFSPRLADEIESLTSTTKPSATQSSADIVQQMLAKHGKNLSEDARQKIADAVQETAISVSGGNVIVADFSRHGLVGDEIRIAHYDIRGSMGGGQKAADFPEMLKDIRVSQKHLRELGVEYEDYNYLKLVTGWGQSMAPTIKHRDPLIVDISIRDFVGDGIYLFSWDDLLYIKRLQVSDSDNFEMISDSTHHPTKPIRRDDTHILARVLLVWNAHLV
ncbi:S24 family peptidase [Pseudomonas sp. RTC3]|uniref:S24 family peptidase n=1 Tax=Pseudomonas sp. 5C2 TaxID=3048588 RepID=UPI002AB438DE|nr:S24 family peptidase [Pseudomonas sp. 5C2]MDY7565813.1 S24 family peptidase [Pseudomonas sp. 5C2]MEB0062482.1 S24 family peptidase [Pseudomonas sp. RTC3]MEB0240487.1 S24 family peptidase [Pseudomonas sp. 5C2]